MRTLRLDLLVAVALAGCSTTVDNDLAFGSGSGGAELDGTETAETTSGTTSASESSGEGAETTEGSDEGPNTTGPPPCGNGIIDNDEECDQAQFGELTCRDFINARGEPFDGGGLICGVETCEISTEACLDFVCGDGVVTEDEECDGRILDAVESSCIAYFAGRGSVTCSDTCRYDLSDCSTCGNGQLDGNEPCDGEAINPRVTCEALGFGPGTLTCLPGCYVDVTGCSEQQR